MLSKLFARRKAKREMSGAWRREQARLDELRRLSAAEHADRLRSELAGPGSRRYSDLHFAR